ncbi:hypothetical protein F5Y03DRAFT_397434 [Xylaria venustula]|nr:hypothetical protein F5Y03DRAFT_397434 [Xylaria venustula]
MAVKILRRRDESSGVGLRAVLAAQSEGAVPVPIPFPPTTAEAVKETNTFTLASFTAQDAWELGHLLYARLLPFEKPTLISIALAHSQHVLFQAAVGSGTAPDNALWVQRKRNAVLRFGASTWELHCKYDGDEEAFRKKFGMSEDVAGGYAIHGGGVPSEFIPGDGGDVLCLFTPVRVAGVEGIVAVVVVSGLKQHEDHGVIVDVINNNWE